MEVLKQKGLPSTVYAEAIDSLLPGVWKYWEFETLWSELLHEIAFPISDEVKNKIRAYKACLNSTVPFQSWGVFLNVCAAFNEMDVDPRIAKSFRPPQLLWTMKHMKDINPDAEFSNDVLGIVSAMLFDHGIIWLPGEIGETLNPYLRSLVPNDSEDLIREIENTYADSVVPNVDSPEEASVLEALVARIIPIANYIDTNLRLEKGARHEHTT